MGAWPTSLALVPLATVVLMIGWSRKFRPRNAVAETATQIVAVSLRLRFLLRSKKKRIPGSDISTILVKMPLPENFHLKTIVCREIRWVM